MPKLLFFLLIISVSVSLHTQTPTAINTTLYFQSQFTSIDSQLDFVTRTVDLNDSIKFSAFLQLSKQAKSAITALHKSLLKYNLTVNSRVNLCAKVTTFNRTDLRRYISYFEQKEEAMNNYIATCADCSFISEDFNDLMNKTYVFFTRLNNTLDGMYCNWSIPDNLGQIGKDLVNLNASYFKCNLNSKNWYYGTTTITDYKIYLFKRSTTYNLTSCPIQLPFVRDQQQICFDCPEGSMFNLGKRNCDTCKPNEILNIVKGRCDQCLGSKIIVNGTLQCQPCLIANGQLFNATSGKCYKCSAGSYLQITKFECLKINCTIPTPRFNNITKKCEACGVSQAIDPLDSTKCIKTNYIGICPEQTPYFDKSTYTCVACPPQTRFDSIISKCSPITAHHRTSII